MPARRSALPVLVVLAFVAVSPFVRALQAPAPVTPATEELRIGDSVLPLNGPWKFQIGDSPIDPVTNKPVWAEASFDDSAWEDVDLTVPEGSSDPISGTTGYLHGWTAKGHRGYWGYAWYRIRVRIQARPGMPLAIAGPSDVDDVYQVFANGNWIGEFGRFTSKRPNIYSTRPEMFSLPADTASGSTTQVLAFRVFLDPSTLSQTDDAGGFHNPPLVGEYAAVSAQNAVKWQEFYRAYGPSFMASLFYGLLGCIILSLALLDRSDHVYLWVGGVLLLTSCTGLITTISTLTLLIPYSVSGFGRLCILSPLAYAGWVMVWRAWFRLRGPAWVPWLNLGLFLLLAVSQTISQNLLVGAMPHDVRSIFHMISFGVRLGIAVLLVLTVIRGIREQGIDGWIVLPAVILAGFSLFDDELNYYHIFPALFPFGIQVNTHVLSTLLLVSSLAVLLLRRLVKSIRYQRQIALDIKQAQEVQQVILPDANSSIPGLDVESEYRPALEVGGDFFQIIPDPSDGSLLIVTGDVAGKGLPAGMLVALLVGAIRTSLHFDPSPLTLLETLNQRLRGRGDACATCLAMRIQANGDVMLVNAGHPAPYLNGKPIECPGALPLGMLDEPDFSVTHFTLKPADLLILLSDGIAEAADSNGNLFGFDRIEQLLSSNVTAADVAQAAQSFGQQDDISVITVTRTAVAEPVPA